MDLGRASAILAAVGLGSLTGCNGEQASPSAPAEPVVVQPKHVVLISVDTLRQDALRAYSEDATALPNVDRLAARSAILQGHSTASWTLPATASLLCGLYPDRHAATAPKRRFGGGMPTLARAMTKRGFETVGFTEGGYLNQFYGLRRGFQRYDTWAATPAARKLQRQLPRRGKRTVETGQRLFDRAIKFLDQRGAQAKPFFLFLQTYSVHDYFRVRPWVKRHLPGVALGDRKHYSQCLLGRKKSQPEDWQRLRELYRAELKHFDQGFGRLTKALARHGLAKDTLVVLLSDHGEGFDPERGRTHHGGRLHEDQLRVPFLVAGPGIVPDRIPTPVSLVDVMPTILDLVGSPSPDVDGISLAPLLRGDDPPDVRPLFAMEHHHYWEDGERFKFEKPREEALAIAVMLGPMWYIDGGSGAGELYHMDADPLQLAPLAPADQRGAALRALATERREKRSTGEIQELPTDVQDELNKLGYTGKSKPKAKGK